MTPLVSIDARPQALHLLDLASVLGATLLMTAIALRLLSVPWHTSTMAAAVCAALLGYILADLAAGIVHWFCDTFFAEDTPVIGRAFIHPFREHHRDPLAMTRHGFLEVNGSNALVMVPLLALAWIFGGIGNVGAVFAQALALAFALATFATNQFHKWAHVPSPPPAVRWLQARGLILSPIHHLRHHTPPYRQSFCVTVGILDPVLDRLRVFARIEQGVRWLQARR